MSVRTSTTTASRRVRATRAAARSDVYLFLARGFAYPRFSLEELHASARQAAEALGEDSLRLISQLRIPPLEELETQYISTFGHTVQQDCPAYEMEYSQGHIFMQSHSLAELAAFYQAFGVQAGSGERLDHIGTELEFMYFLVYREAHDLVSGLKKGAGICRDGQRRFLEKHLGRWAPLFMTKIEQQTEGLYCQLAEATLAWLDMEIKELDAHPRQLGEEALLGGLSDSLFDLGEGLCPCEEVES